MGRAGLSFDKGAASRLPGRLRTASSRRGRWRTAWRRPDLDRCIGGGNRAVTCPTGAITMQRKPQLQVPLKDKDVTSLEMLRRRHGRGKAPVTRAKMALGMEA
jgi:ferredoxin